MESLLSVKEFADRLRVSHWTIHAWLSQGRLTRMKVGSRTLLRESELERVVVDGGKSRSPRKARKPKS